MPCHEQHPRGRDAPWEQINESQAREWSHKCAACAYERGFQAGLRRGIDLAGEMTRRLQREPA